ncbi:MAG: portal protein [Rhodospirillaceae bacterium]|nr:portal protein [Rhodospirillaceae bacterium]
MATTNSTREQCLKRLGSLKLERESWIAHWRDISDMILPRRGRFIVSDRNKGVRRNRKIIDNTGTLAHRTMSSGLMSGITSPARPWFRLATRHGQTMEDKQLKAWLSDVEALMREVFNRSNLYDSLAQLYDELAAFGTAVLLVYEDFDDVISCETLTAGQFCIAPDRRGRIDTLYREYSLTVGQVVDEFCPGNGDNRDFSRVSEAVKSAWNSGNRDTWIEIIQAIEPNPGYKPGPGPSKAKRYRSTWMEANSSGDRLLRQSGFDEFPALVARWNVAPSDIYGQSPAMDALGDVEQLQMQEIEKSKAIQKMVSPPLNVPASLQSNTVVNPLPNGTTFYNQAAGQLPMASPLYQVNPRLAEMQADMDAVRQRIRAAFYADLWLMISEMERSGVTAYEISIRREEKLLMLGPVLERLHHELLDPLIDRVFAIVARAGLLPPVPDGLSDGGDLQVQYTSMLAQAQRSVSTVAIERLFSFVGNLAAANQAVLDKVDFDQAVDEYGEAIDAPARLILSDADVAKIREARAQAQQQAQAMQAATMMAQNAQVLSKADTGGRNALTDILSNVTGSV